MSESRYGHYYRNVSHLDYIDIYRVLELFGVSDPCLQHAAKKILVAGGRGSKDFEKDLDEAIATLQRKKLMLEEDRRLAKP